jgi:hypothetical protein
MYNEVQKLRFLETINIDSYPPNFWNQLFNNTTEEILQKDLYDYNLNQICEFYKMKFTSSIDRLRVLNYALRDYCQWAINENLVFDGQNHYLEVNNDILRNCINKKDISGMLFKRADLLQIIQKFDNPRDAFIYIAIYEGIKIEELIDLNIGDIDQRKKTVKLSSGREIELSSECINYAIKANQEYTYYIENTRTIQKRGLEGKNVVKYLVSSKQMMKDEKFVHKIAIEKVCIKLWKNFGCPRTPRDIRIAGILDAIYAYTEKNNIDISKITSSDFTPEFRNQYGLSNSGVSRIINRFFSWE